MVGQEGSRDEGLEWDMKEDGTEASEEMAFPRHSEEDSTILFSEFRRKVAIS